MTRCPFCDSKNPPGTTRCSSCGAELSVDAEPAHEGSDNLDEAVQALLRDGQKIEAVKLYREKTGVGLAEAKQAVEAIERGEDLPPSAEASSGSERDVVDLLRAGRKIEAIKLYREQTGAGLAEAKQAVEQLGREHGITTGGGGCAGVLLVCAIVVVVVVGGVL